MRKVLARRIAIDSFILMITSYAVGSHVLSFFGISLPVVQVGGGLIVISIGWAMLAQKDEDENERDQVGRQVDCSHFLKDAFYPLTLPLTVGPGTISVAITLGANAPRSLVANLLSLLAAAIGTVTVAVTIYLFYGFADRLSALIGPTGLKVMIKLTAFLLVCIGVQILWNGASQLISSLPAFRS
jgi:multiple antibiotic resistance protein